MFNAFRLILLSLFALMFASPPAMAQVPAAPREGCDSCQMKITDLDQPIKLTGQWLFTRDDKPTNKDVGIDTSGWPLVTTPGPWKKVYGDGKNFRVGWYRGTFEFAPALVGKEVVLLIDAYMGRMSVYVDGKDLFHRPASINVERYYATQPVPVRFHVTKASHDVAIRVDTPLMTGIYQQPFELRAYDANDASLAWYQLRGGELRFVAGFVSLLFGLFFLLVYKKTKYSLYLVASLELIMVVPFFVAPTDVMLRVFDPDTLLYLHYPGLFSFFLAYVFCQYFNTFKPRLNWVAAVVYAVLACGFVVQAIQPNLDVFQKLRSLFFALALLFGIGCLVETFLGALKRKPGARILFAGMLVFFYCGVHDMLLAVGLIQSTSLSFMGVTAFTVAVLYVASSLFANTFSENRRLVSDLKGLNDNLEGLVAQRTSQLREKTNDINSMLQNMPQGVLTVVDGNIIHPEYSTYLEEIFETKDIAGRSAMDVIFSGSSLGSDVLSQVGAVAGACIGEDRMNFEFNSHLMVTEFDKKMPSGQTKSLELSWSPICNDNDMCEKLMMCVRDVTALKTLQAEAGQQKRELEMIGQILSVNQEKFHEFIDSSNQFIAENKALITEATEKEAGTVGHLFRNMHTIKGNARTYGLLHLTNVVHEAEQTYDALRSKTDMEWNRDQLLGQLQVAQDAIDMYAKINEVKLGRKGPGRRGGVDRFLMVQVDHIQQALKSLDQVDMADPDALRAAMRQVRNTLRLIGTQRVEDILAGIYDSLPSLAKELGKEPPKIEVRDNGVFIRNQIADLLKNVFMHLYRNSMDHGLESADERIAAGKPAAGTISMELMRTDSELRFTLYDDGKGLALGVIRRKAVEKQLITTDQQLSEHAVAQLIFAAGFSTAEEVTEVSGRGVGMDAVREFVEREGGSIELHFRDDNNGAEFRAFETVITLPAKFGVVSEE